MPCKYCGHTKIAYKIVQKKIEKKRSGILIFPNFLQPLDTPK